MRYFLISIILLFLYSCHEDSEYCYEVSYINMPSEDEVSSVTFIYYKIESERLIKKIKGKHLVNDVYQNNIEEIKFIKNNKEIYSNSSSKIKMDKKNNVYIVYGSSRFETRDSLDIYNKIFDEKLHLKLKNNEEYYLEKCN